MVERNLDLRGPHPLVCGYQPFGQELPFRVEGKEGQMAVLVVLGHVLRERVERLGDVAGGGQNDRETREGAWGHYLVSAGVKV